MNGNGGLFDTSEGHLAQTLYDTYYFSELGINWRWQATSNPPFAHF
jgi:hypothetical protein